MLGQPGDHGGHEHTHGDTSLRECFDGREAACRLGGTRLQQARETAIEGRDRQKDGSRLIAGSLVADPLRTLFGAPTNTPDRNYVNVAAGVTATLPRGVSGFVHYETVLGRDRVTTHSFTAGLRLQFD